MILVTGVTGRVGGALARYLLEGGQEVAGLVRDPKQIDDLPAGVRGFVGNLEQPESMKEALEAVDSVFFLAGIDAIEGLYEMAGKAGVRHVLQLSGLVALAGDSPNFITRFMMHDEQVAKASGLAYTFLRPGSFTSNALRWANQVRGGNTVRLPFDSCPEALIDADDIGRVGATILAAPDKHAGKAYELSGPQLLRPSDCVRLVGEAINDLNQRLYDTVERLTGTPPRTFETWAREHAAAFIA